MPAEFGTTVGRLGAAADAADATPAPARQPLAVFVIGQTGAGKTRTAPALKVAMRAVRGGDREEPAHFIADTYKAYHPSYARLAAERPGLASAATGPDARRWLAMATDRAAALRIDVLLESACRHAADFAALARALARSPHGAYRVEVAVLAAPRALSLLGVLARFHLRGRPSLVEEEGQGQGSARVLPARLTPRTVHDESYAGVMEAAAFIDGVGSESDRDHGADAAVVDQVVVVRRDNLVAYADERGPDGRWMRSRPGSAGRGGVAAALEAERRRPLTPGERAAADADLLLLRGLGVPALETQLAEIEAMLGSEPVVPGPPGEGDGPRPDGSSPEFPALKPLILPGLGSGLDTDGELSLRLGT